MNDQNTANLTNVQLLVRNYAVPMLFILTGTALGYYLATNSKRKVAL